MSTLTEQPASRRVTPSLRRRGAPKLRRLVPSLGIGAVLGYLVLVPLVFILWSSVKPTGLVIDPGFTLTNYADLLLRSDIVPLFFNTLTFAAGSTIAALVIGGGLAWLIERTDVPARRILRTMIVLPMATPPVLLAIAWAMLLDPRAGALNDLIQQLAGFSPVNIYSMGGMIFVQALVLVPSTFLILSPAFRNMDPNLEDAALASGASRWVTLRRVVLPILTPAILAAGAFLFIVGFVVFDVPGVIGLRAREFTFSTEIVNFAQNSVSGLPEYGRLSALTVLLVLFLLMTAAAYSWFTRLSHRYVTVGGKSYRARRIRLGRGRPLAAGLASLYVLLAIGLPVAMLAWTSLLPYRSGVSVSMLPLLTLDNYGAFLANDRLVRAATNSTVISLVTATAVVFLSAAVAWAVVRAKVPGRRLLDTMAFMPLAMGGVMMGVALIYVYLSFSAIPIYGSIWIITIAYITLYTSFGSKLAGGIMVQLHPELEEAGSASGASRWQSFRRITLPLMRPALIGLWVWVVAHALRELSTALMLRGLENETLATLLWSFWESGRPTTAAAVGIAMIAVLTLLIGGWQLLMRRSESEWEGM